jgi:hypothetical protein
VTKDELARRWKKRQTQGLSIAASMARLARLSKRVRDNIEHCLPERDEEWDAIQQAIRENSRIVAADPRLWRMLMRELAIQDQIFAACHELMEANEPAPMHEAGPHDALDC